MFPFLTGTIPRPITRARAGRVIGIKGPLKWLVVHDPFARFDGQLRNLAWRFLHAYQVSLLLHI